MKPQLYIILITFILSLSCQEAADVYLGIPLQPGIDDNLFEPGLNIIGVIRPDFVDGMNNSFVHVQEVAPAINNYPEFTPDSLIVTSADVTLSDSTGNIFEFNYTDDNIYGKNDYRPDSTFRPTEGTLFFITCSYDTLPMLTSATIVPNKPMILDSTISVINNTLTFDLAENNTIYLYDIYVLHGNNTVGYSRTIASNSENTKITVGLSSSQPDKIEIYGYDYNLSDYYINSNTSLNFNKYRKPFGNVENGYGVFGSLNFAYYSF